MTDCSTTTTKTLHEDMRSGADPPLPELHAWHRREVLVESAVPLDVATARGYRTIDREEALRLGFAATQARAGMLVPLYSPDGRRSYQLKPFNPRKNRDGDEIKYDTPYGWENVVDFHPHHWQHLRRADVPLVVTEGAKTGDAITGYAPEHTPWRTDVPAKKPESVPYAVAVLSGVWNFGVKRKNAKGKKVGKSELLEDWHHVALEGRRVVLLFDNDWRSKPGVAHAMDVLAERLEEQGAHVFIGSLPIGTGKKVGADDFVASSGDLGAVLENAEAWHPYLVTRYIVRDKPVRLRQWVYLIEQRMKRDSWKGRAGETDHGVLTALLHAALRRGKDKEDCASVFISTRDLMRNAAVGSRATLYKSIDRLQERGYLEKIAGNRAKGVPNEYRLLPEVTYLEGTGTRTKVDESVTHTRTRVDERLDSESISFPCPINTGTPVSHREYRHLPGNDPTGRQKYPAAHSRDTLAVCYHTAPAAPERERRSPYQGRLPARPGRSGIGKLSGRVVQHLRLDPQPRIADLADALGVRANNLRARTLNKLEKLGIVSMDAKGTRGGRVWLAEGWQKALEEATQDDTSARRRMSQQNRRSRTAYDLHRSGRYEAETAPPLAGPENVACILEAAEERDRKRKEDKYRAALDADPPEGTVDEWLLWMLRETNFKSLSGLQDLWMNAHCGKAYEVAYAVDRLGLVLHEDGDKKWLTLPETQTEGA